jgi:hypothetical protein
MLFFKSSDYILNMMKKIYMLELQLSPYSWCYLRCPWIAGGCTALYLDRRPAPAFKELLGDYRITIEESGTSPTPILPTAYRFKSHGSSLSYHAGKFPPLLVSLR